MRKTLGDIFAPGTINLNLAGKTKDSVLSELISGIYASYPQYNTSDMLRAISQRENQMTTGIGSGVAIPHAFCKGIDNMVGAIGISKSGIDYGAIDNKPVHVVFLLAINEKAEEKHLRIINLIFNIIKSEAITQIKNAKRAEDIHSILLRMH
jgi:mannitol/fructose-specific phosphotransferase system IIA component (Ntr-type)